MSSGRLHIGTSGFVYKDWRGLFYPPKLAARSWLSYYAGVFTTVELNNTFYQLAREAAVARWRQETPAQFRFVAKGSRFITHMKRLKEPAKALERYYEPLRQLDRKLIAVLWQLPPQMNKPDPERLDAFLRLQPKRYRQILEFRSEAWHHDEVLAVLDAHHAAICEHDLVGTRPPRITGGFRYLRFHGTTGNYEGQYGARRLRRFAKDLAAWRDAGREAFVYFNNDRFGHAVLDALTFSELVGAPAQLPAEASGVLRATPHAGVLR